MFAELTKEISKKVAEKLDESLPDGVVQQVVGLALVEIGAAVSSAGTQLATAENADGDK